MNVIPFSNTSEPKQSPVEATIQNVLQEELGRQHVKWLEAVESGKRYTLAVALMVSGAICFVAGLFDWLADGLLSRPAASIVSAGALGLVLGVVLWLRHRGAENQRLFLLDEAGDITKEDFTHIRCLS